MISFNFSLRVGEVIDASLLNGVSFCGDSENVVSLWVDGTCCMVGGETLVVLDSSSSQSGWATDPLTGRVRSILPCLPACRVYLLSFPCLALPQRVCVFSCRVSHSRPSPQLLLDPLACHSSLFHPLSSLSSMPYPTIFSLLRPLPCSVSLSIFPCIHLRQASFSPVSKPSNLHFSSQLHHSPSFFLCLSLLHCSAPHPCTSSSPSCSFPGVPPLSIFLFIFITELHLP